MVNNKATGSFFTPGPLANAIARYLSMSACWENSAVDILEPSVGHGVFLNSLDQIAEDRPDLKFNITAIDIDEAFIKECGSTPRIHNNISYLCQDFITYDSRGKKFDLVIGNPPYVTYKLLSDSQNNLGRNYFFENALNPSHFLNLYTLFVDKSARLLKENGIICFVLPKEFLYVNHADWLRRSLLAKFSRVELFIMDDFHFSQAEQDVVILICYKLHSQPGLYVDDSGVFSGKNDGLSPIEKGPDIGKWSHYKVSSDDSLLVSRHISDLKPVSYYCKAVAGIVTAANSFFILRKSEVQTRGFEQFVLPIIQHSAFLQSNLEVSEKVWQHLVDADHPAFLLAKFDHESPPEALGTYLKDGVDLGLPNRYKMTTREPWHNIPSIWASDAIFFKRMDRMPKFVANPSKLLVTDSGYRVTALPPFNVRSLIYSFYNSLTLVQCELRGRSYGGGVLELTPNEFKGLRVPYIDVDSVQFEAFSHSFSTLQFDLALDSHDQKILPLIGLTPFQIENIQNLRRQLFERRTKKKAKK